MPAFLYTKFTTKCTTVLFFFNHLTSSKICERVQALQLIIEDKQQKQALKSATSGKKSNSNSLQIFTLITWDNSLIDRVDKAIDLQNANNNYGRWLRL